MLVERLGRFDKIASGGLNILVPFLDRPRAVYWTTHSPRADFNRSARTIHRPAAQPVITRDNVHHPRRFSCLLAITDPVKASTR